MATQKKGCGFLLTALIIFILGGGIAAFLGYGAFKTGKDFTQNITNGEFLVTPGTLTYTHKEEGEITVWISGDENTDLSKIEVEFTDPLTGVTQKSAKPDGSGFINDKHLLAVFSAEKDKTYEVTAKGAADGSTVWLSSVSSNAILSMVGKGLGAFGVGGISIVLALILGIIGMVKFFGSKNTSTQQTPPPIR